MVNTLPKLPRLQIISKIRDVNDIFVFLLFFERQNIAAKRSADPTHCAIETDSPTNINGDTISGNTTPPAIEKASTVQSETLFAARIQTKRKTPFEIPEKTEITVPTLSRGTRPEARQTIRLTTVHPRERITLMIILFLGPDAMLQQFLTAIFFYDSGNI